MRICKKLFLLVISVLLVSLPVPSFAFEYVLDEEFDNVPQNMELNLNDLENTGHTITFEESAAHISKAGDLGIPDITAKFEPIYDNVVIEMELNIDEGQFTLMDDKGQQVINFYTRANSDTQLEMRVSSAVKHRITYNRGTWRKMKFVVDFAADTFAVYLDDDNKLLISDWVLMGERSNAAAFRFQQNGSGKTSSLRYLKISRQPEDVTAKDAAYVSGTLAPALQSIDADLTLPAKGPHGSDISWSSEDNSIITIGSDGVSATINRPPFEGEDAQVSLTAAISFNEYQLEQDIMVKVLKRFSDEALVQATYDALTLEYTDHIISGFSLPVSGKDGTKITWTSSDENVIQINETGAAVTPRPAEAADVILTATVTSGAVSRTKQFTIHVLAGIGENLAEKAAVSGSTQTAANPAQAAVNADFNHGWQPVLTEPAPYLLLDTGSEKQVTHIRFRPYGKTPLEYRAEISLDGKKFTLLQSGTMPVEAVTLIALEDMAEFRYFKFTISNPELVECGLYELQVFDAPTDAQIIQADMEAFRFEQISGEQPEKIKNDLHLVTTGEKGSQITYHSSDLSLLQISGSTGRVTRPSGKTDKPVMLTVRFASGQEWKELNLSLSIAATGENGSGTSGGGGTGGGGGIFSGKTVEVPMAATPAPTAPPQTNQPDFRDLMGYGWAEEAILALSEKGILTGDGDGLFRPQDSISREEFAAVLVKAFGIETEKTESRFTDVPGNSWCTSYVETAAEAGIVRGIGGGRFGMGEPITRQDMAVMLFRAAQNAIPADGEAKLAFADMEEIAPYAQKAVTQLSGTGVFGGKENGRFAPLDFTTRAEAAVVIFRILGK